MNEGGAPQQDGRPEAAGPRLEVRFVPPAPERFAVTLAIAATVFCMAMAIGATHQHAVIHDVGWAEALADAALLRGIVVFSAVMLWFLILCVPLWWRRACARSLMLEGTQVRLRGPGPLWTLGTRTWEGEVTQVRGPAQRLRLAGMSLVLEVDGVHWSFPLAHGKLSSGEGRWWKRFETDWTNARVLAARRSQEPPECV